MTQTQCIWRHRWAGCRCERCGELRDRDHDWAGCRCSRCGLVRDQDHDWELDGCRFLCQRCGHHREAVHDWDGCVCQRCVATRHRWNDGECADCGERCRHLQTEVVYEWDDGFEPDETAHVVHCQRHRVCKRCGMVVGDHAGTSN